MTTTPFRLSLTNTIRFEPVLRQILSTDWNSDVTLRFNPLTLGINTTTARARLLDALLSLIDGKTALPNFDVERLRTMRPLFYITADEVGYVLISPKTKKEPHSTAQSVAVDVVAGGRALASPVVLDPKTPQFEARLRAFALLLGSRDLTVPVRVKGKVNDTLLAELTSTFDVAYTPDGDDTLIM